MLFCFCCFTIIVAFAFWVFPVIIFIALILNSVLYLSLINVACSSMFLLYSFSLASVGFHEISFWVSLQILRHVDFAEFEAAIMIVSDEYFLKKTLHIEISLFYIQHFLYYRLIHVINKTSFAPRASYKCWVRFSNWLKLYAITGVYSGYSENYNTK
jgi:hypothetical protein